MAINQKRIELTFGELITPPVYVNVYSNQGNLAIAENKILIKTWSQVFKFYRAVNSFDISLIIALYRAGSYQLVSVFHKIFSRQESMTVLFGFVK